MVYKRDTGFKILFLLMILFALYSNREVDCLDFQEIFELDGLGVPHFILIYAGISTE